MRLLLPLSHPLGRARLALRATAGTQRRVGVATLLTDTFLMNLGFGILVPLLAIHFTGHLGFTAASIGLVLALRQFAQQGLDLFAGAFGDRVGARTSIALGCFVRAAGFLGIGFSHTLPELLGWALVSGIGGAFFDAPGTAALADLVAPEQHQRAFAASATCGNIGATVGPLVGVALLAISFPMLGVVAALCFALIGLLTLALLPSYVLRGVRASDPARSTPRGGTQGERRGGTRGAGMDFVATVRLLCRDRAFVWLTILLAGFWFIWAQINITVPLVAAQQGGASLAARALAVNSGVAIALQYPLSSLASRRFSPRLLLALCTVLSAVGMALVFVSPLTTVLFVGIVIFALGRMVIGPVINAVTAHMAPAGRLGAYFGFGALAIAVGAGGGQVAGGALYDLAQRLHQPALLWGSMLLAGAVVVVGLTRLRLPD